MSAQISVAAAEDLHAWEAGGAVSAEALSAWVSARLAAHEAALAALLAVKGRARRRTPCVFTMWRLSSSTWPARRPAS